MGSNEVMYLKDVAHRVNSSHMVAAIVGIITFHKPMEALE